MNLTKITGATYVLSAGASSSAIPSAIKTLKIRVATTAAIYLAIGTVGVTASAANLVVPANAVEYFTIEQSSLKTYVAVIQVTTTGQVSITEVA